MKLEGIVAYKNTKELSYSSSKFYFIFDILFGVYVDNNEGKPILYIGYIWTLEYAIGHLVNIGHEYCNTVLYQYMLG